MLTLPAMAVDAQSHMRGSLIELRSPHGHGWQRGIVVRTEPCGRRPGATTTWTFGDEESCRSGKTRMQYTPIMHVMHIRCSQLRLWCVSLNAQCGHLGRGQRPR